MTRVAPQLLHVPVMTMHRKTMSAHSHHTLLRDICQRTALEGTREQLEADMTTGAVVPSGLQAHAKWSTVLYNLDASSLESCIRMVTVGLQSLRSCYSMENVEC